MRLDVDFGVRREQQIAAGLPGVGLLRARLHHHARIEDTASASGGDAAPGLAARGVRRGVLDMQMLVDVASRIGDEEAVKLAFGAGLIQVHPGVVARQAAAEADRQGMIAAVARLLYRGQAGMGGGHAFLGQLQVGQPRAFAQHDLGDRVVPVGEVGAAPVMLHQHRLGTGFQHHEVAHVQHGVGLAGTVRHEQRRQRAAGGNVQEQPVPPQRAVDLGQRRAARDPAGKLAEVSGHRRGVGMRGEAVRLDHARIGIDQAAIAESQQRPRIILGHDGFRSLLRRMPFGLFQRGERGVFPVFFTRGRQPAREKALQRLAARSETIGRRTDGVERLAVAAGSLRIHGRVSSCASGISQP